MEDDAWGEDDFDAIWVCFPNAVLPGSKALLQAHPFGQCSPPAAHGMACYARVVFAHTSDMAYFLVYAMSRLSLACGVVVVALFGTKNLQEVVLLYHAMVFGEHLPD